MAFCSNCKKETHRYKMLGEGRVFCLNCSRNPARDACSTPFPFTADHLEGRPTFNSLAEVRQYESRHGVAFDAFNFNQKGHSAERVSEWFANRRERMYREEVNSRRPNFNR